MLNDSEAHHAYKAMRFTLFSTSYTLYAWSKTALAVLNRQDLEGVQTALSFAHPLPISTVDARCLSTRLSIVKHWRAKLQLSLLKQLKLFYSKQLTT